MDQRKKNAEKPDAPEETDFAQRFFDSLKGFENPDAGGAARRLLSHIGLDSDLNLRNFHIHHLYYIKTGKSQGEKVFRWWILKF